ncbi:MAG: hypothetical protein FJY65_01075 [Calditrichaeota bacterium]|nr:hypothetical protein [Calditrichota bacterium]
MKRSTSFQCFIIYIFAAAALCAAVAGCGGNKLAPLECAKYIAKALGTPQYNVQVTTSFRTAVILKLPVTTLNGARDAERTLIEHFIAYAQENAISDFGNDSLLFHIRLDTNPDITMKWRSTTMDLKEHLAGKMSLEEFIDRCQKEENWSEDFG